jgi:hypothetical protein
MSKCYPDTSFLSPWLRPPRSSSTPGNGRTCRGEATNAISEVLSPVHELLTISRDEFQDLTGIMSPIHRHRKHIHR